MASPGLGYRLACDVLCEVSLHLIEPIVFTTLTQDATVGGYSDGGYSEGGYSDPIDSLVYLLSTDNLYVGAMIVVGWGLDTAEVATVLEINDDGTVLLSTLANPHFTGETVLAPTFSYQQPTDPAFTQAEALGYLSRAQNELLSAVPTYYQLTQQPAVFGQIFQNTPANCIEINRIAISQTYIAIATLSRTSNLVTLTSVDPHGLGAHSTIFVQTGAAGWGGVFEVLTVPSPTTLTYRQDAADSSTTTGAILYWKRAYETTLAELNMTNRTWQNGYTQSPGSWFEDRSGLYRFGLGGKPASNYPLELLCSIRDTDTLGLLDGFLIPDILVPTLKYKTLAYFWSKDGIQQDPARAQYCEMRYQRGVAAIQRYLEGFNLGLKQEASVA